METISVTGGDLGYTHVADFIADGVDEQVRARLYVAWQSTLCKMDAEAGDILWSLHIPGLGTGCAVYGDCVYAYSSYQESHVYAFREDDGQKLWSIQLAPHASNASVALNEILALAVTHHMLYVLTRDGTVTMLDRANGNLLSSYATRTLDENHLGTIELVIHDDVFYDIHQHHLSAVDMRTLCRRWESSIDAPQVFLTHAFAENVLYAIADLDPVGMYAYAFDCETGAQLWRSDLLCDPIFDAPVVSGGRLYCAGATTLFVFDARDGQLLWECPLGLSTYIKPCVVDNTLYIGMQASFTDAISAADNGPDKPAVDTSDSDTGGDGVRGGDGAFLALNCVDGAVSWMQSWNACPGTYAVDRQHMYIGFPQYGEIYAFDKANGALLWRSRSPQMNEGPCQVLVPHSSYGNGR